MKKVSASHVTKTKISFTDTTEFSCLMEHQLAQSAGWLKKIEIMTDVLILFYGLSDKKDRKRWKILRYLIRKNFHIQENIYYEKVHMYCQSCLSFMPSKAKYLFLVPFSDLSLSKSMYFIKFGENSPLDIWRYSCIII